MNQPVFTLESQDIPPLHVEGNMDQLLYEFINRFALIDGAARFRLLQFNPSYYPA